MTEAINTPVRRPRRENNTADTAIGQMDPIGLDEDDGLPDRIVEADETALIAAHTAALKFAEEPVTVIINQSTERGAPLTVDCWVNGKGIELWMNGRWISSGWAPVNRELITKRKYVEVLVRSKTTSYTTEHGEPGDAHIFNRAIPNTSIRNNISVLADKNPLGREWLSRLMAERE